MQDPKPQFFDTNKYVTSLIQAGMSKDQAEVFVNAQVQILLQVNSIEARLQALDRKVDDKIRELRSEIQNTKNELRGEIRDTKDELRGEIQNVENKLGEKIEAANKGVTTKIALGVGFLCVFVTIVGVLLALQNIHLATLLKIS